MKNLLLYNILLFLFFFSFVATAQNLQDPTKPKVAIESKGSGVLSNNEIVKEQLVLQSVYVKQSGYLAIVTGEMVKIGDLIQGYSVKKITANSVTLEQGQTRKILRLYQHEIKQ